MSNSHSIGFLPVQNAADFEGLEDNSFVPGKEVPADVNREQAGGADASTGKPNAFGPTFRKNQSAIREQNHSSGSASRMSSGKVVPFEQDSMFLSHSWRNPVLQTTKKDMFAHLTDKGCVFWADFLDLQDSGPVSWRKEIEDAISGCSKFVAFVDTQYLLSFNCIEELAYAIQHKKPIVMAIMDQGAWDLLTCIGGAKKAWSQAPASGNPLSSYDGQSTSGSNRRFSFEFLEEVFRTISSINFCPCRELDLANDGLESVCDRLYSFVTKDLEYAKEFASLKRKADNWISSGKPSGMLLSEKESKDWKHWLDMASRQGNFLDPDDAQCELVTKSVEKSKSQRNFRLTVLALAVFLIFAGGVAAVAMAIHADYQRAEASKQRMFAEQARDSADVQRRKAEEHSRVADEQRKIAEEREAEAERQGAIASTLLLSADRSPFTTAGVRALLRAADEANKFNITGVILPALHETLEHLLYTPYQFLDLEGHNSRIHAVDFSPLETKILTCSSDGTIRVWPISWPSSSFVPDLVVPHTMPQEEDCELAQWISDTKFVAVFKDGSMHVWEEQGGAWTMAHNIEAHGKKVTALAVSSDKSLIATGSKDKKIALWSFDSTTGEPISEWSNKVGATTQTLAFSPDGQKLVADINSGTITLLDVNGDGEHEIAMPNGTAGGAETMEFSPDGNVLAVGLSDGDIHLLSWNEADPASSAFRHILSSPSPTESLLKQIKGLTWKSATSIVGVADDGTVTIWDINDMNTPEETATVRDQIVYRTSLTSSAIPLTGVSFAGGLGGGALAVSSENSMLRLYYPTPSLGSHGPATAQIRNSMDKNVEIMAVAWSQSGDRVAACSREGDLGIWHQDEQGQGWTEVLFAKAHKIDDDSTPCRSLIWSPDGSMVAAGTDANTVEVWQQVTAGDWRHLMSGNATGNVRRDPSFSHNGKYLAASYKGGSDIKVFRVPADPVVEAVEPVLVIEGNEEGEIKAIAWAPVLSKVSISEDPTLVLASSEEDGLHLWELKEDPDSEGLSIAGVIELNDLGNIYATRLDWSPLGMLCAMAPEGMGAVWNYKQSGGWTALATIEGHTGILGKMSWSKDGTSLAVPFEDSSVRIFEVDADVGQASALWQIEARCEWLRWLSSDSKNDMADRVACANTVGALASSGDVYDFSMDMMMASFEEQQELLKLISYGKLTDRDLQTLRLQDLNLQV